MCLSLGRLLFQTGLPDTDPFLFSIADFRWHVWHEWLAYAYYYGLYLLGGFHVIIIFKAFWVTLLAALILYSGRERRPIYTIAILMLAFYVALPRVFADRAAFFTDLFTLGLMTVLCDVNLFRRLKWGIPLLFLVWVQLHPGFILGLILLGLYLLTSSERREAAFILAASLVAVVINPLGVSGALYPLRTVLAPEWNIYREMNSEWVPTLTLPLLPWAYRSLFAVYLFVAGLIVGIYSFQTKKFFPMLSALFLMLLGLSALRFVVVSGLGLGILLTTVEIKNKASPKWLSSTAVSALAVIGLLFGIFRNSISADHGPRILSRLDPLHNSMPYKSARLFAHLPPGPIWNDFDLGGLLAWELNGRMKIAAHGHIDQPALVIKNYLRWTASESDFTELIDGLGVEYMYLRRSSILAERQSFWPKILVTSWDVVYEDPQAVIFRRRQGQDK